MLGNAPARFWSLLTSSFRLSIGNKCTEGDGKKYHAAAPIITVRKRERTKSKIRNPISTLRLLRVAFAFFLLLGELIDVSALEVGSSVSAAACSHGATPGAA